MKRRKPRSLTENEFRKFVAHLDEPIRTPALLCVSFGLRISEALGLRWSDVDWLRGTLRIARGIVMQHVGEVKTNESEKAMAIDAELLAILKRWKLTTEFSAEEDWLFASPVQLGRLPISYPHVWQQFQKAATERSDRCVRHTFPTTHLPLLVGCCGNVDRRSTEAHAPCGHQNYDERVWGCGNR